jgi:hypothetical protein
VAGAKKNTRESAKKVNYYLGLKPVFCFLKPILLFTCYQANQQDKDYKKGSSWINIGFETAVAKAQQINGYLFYHKVDFLS